MQQAISARIILVLLSILIPNRIFASTYVELDSLPANSACVEGVLVVRDRAPGHIFSPPSSTQDYYAIRQDVVASYVYKKLADNFDFLVLFTRVPLAASSASIVNQPAQGIGNAGQSGIFAPYTSKIKAAIEIDAGPSFDVIQYLDIHSAQRAIRKNLLHELGHYWCCYAKGLYPDDQKLLSAHYHFGLELFGKDTTSIDALQAYAWISGSSGYACADFNSPNIQVKYSPLTQYFMGFRLPEEVPPITVHDWDPTTMDNPSSALLGPSCSQPPNFTGTRTVTIQDIIRLNGARAPASANAQKDFNVLPLLVVPYDEQPDTSFLEFIQGTLDSLPQAWFNATDGRAKLHMGCDPAIPIRSERQPGQGVQMVFSSDVLVLSGTQLGSEATVDLHGLSGRKIRTLFQGQVLSNPFSIPLRLSDWAVPTGQYFIRISTGKKQYVRPLMWVP